jgi:hypothetical protein
MTLEGWGEGVAWIPITIFAIFWDVGESPFWLGVYFGHTIRDDEILG